MASDRGHEGDQPPAVDVLGLSKHYGPVEAVRTVTFQVAPREVFAFLGPNGAGTSTTIRMLCTLTRPSAGHARVGGWDVARQPRAVRRSIGLVFQDQTLDEQLTAEENLRFHAVLYGVPGDQVGPRLDRVLDLVDLTSRRRDLVSTYSGGMARRLEIARALLHTPDVLFLDEPTVGLDPQTRARMWEDVLRLRDEEGAAVFFTTHYMDEAEYADRIAIIDHGTIVALDTPAALKAAVGADTVHLRTADDATAAARLRAAGYDVTRATPGGPGVSPGDHGLDVAVADGEAAVGPLVMTTGVAVERVRVHTPDLDDVFLHFTGRQIREQAAEGHAMMRKFAALSRRR